MLEFEFIDNEEFPTIHDLDIITHLVQTLLDYLPVQACVIDDLTHHEFIFVFQTLPHSPDRLPLYLGALLLLLLIFVEVLVGACKEFLGKYVFKVVGYIVAVLD